MIDCIVVGQGLAGTCIALDLTGHGLDCVVFDPGEMSSSQIAAGVMNPVTGRRFVKTWKLEELWEAAVPFFTALQAQLQCDPLCVPVSVLQFLDDPEKHEQWLIRTGDETYDPYLSPVPAQGVINGCRSQVFGEIQSVLQTDLPYLVDCGRNYFVDNEILRPERLDPTQLKVNEDHVVYKDLQARTIIFAEGYRVAANPLFNWLPLNVTRGEILVCRIPDLHSDAILKGPVTIVPMDNGYYWVGSTYSWDPEHDAPSGEGMQYLQEGLTKMLDVPFAVEQHLAAIRPTTTDRRPLVGPHPEHPHVLVLNGMGTKGASLAPYCTLQLSAHLREGREILPEIDIVRHWQR